MPRPALGSRPPDHPAHVTLLDGIDDLEDLVRIEECPLHPGAIDAVPVQLRDAGIEGEAHDLGGVLVGVVEALPSRVVGI